MKTFQKELENLKLTYPIEKIASLNNILFFDIETTGLTAKSSYLYMIGCAFYKQSKWYLIQWLATNYDEEKDVLDAFINFSHNYTHLIHFNGNNFDLPFIIQKCNQYNINQNFESFDGIDLYRRISPYKLFLKIPNCKQKTFEHYLGINRKDTFSGGELISIYHDYVSSPTDHSEKILLLHNSDDVLGMIKILPLLSYYDLFNSAIKVKKVQANQYKDVEQNIAKELLMYFTPPTTLPVSVTANFEDCFFSGYQDEAVIKVPIYEQELKYFYSNYKDYYYLPMEDIALHKSVATFVDKNHRMQAIAANCYTRKNSSYLPQWDIIIKPFFKEDYKSRKFYFEITDEIKKDREKFSIYAEHILQMLWMS